MGRTYRGDDRHRMKKDAKKWRSNRQKKRSVQDDNKSYKNDRRDKDEA